MAYENFMTGDDPMMFDVSETNSDSSGTLEPKVLKGENLSQEELQTPPMEFPTLSQEFPTLSQEFNIIGNLEQENGESPVQKNGSQLMQGEKILDDEVENPPDELPAPERKNKLTELKAVFFDSEIVEATICPDSDEEQDTASSSNITIKLAKEEHSASSSDKIVKPAKEEPSASASDKIVKPAKEPSILNSGIRITKLPLARIKTIMKKDPEVSNPSSEAVFLVTKATEIFIKKMARDAYDAALENKKKSVRLQDVNSAIGTHGYYAFLED